MPWIPPVLTNDSFVFWIDVSDVGRDASTKLGLGRNMAATRLRRIDLEILVRESRDGRRFGGPMGISQSGRYRMRGRCR